MFAPQTILIPTDFSEYSDKAFQQAIDIAKAHNSTICLLHVIDIIRQCVIDYCPEKETINKFEDKNMGVSSMDQLTKQIEKFPEAKPLSITTAVRKGLPYEEILKEQAERKIDLIVISSHGTKELPHNFVGRVAEKVIKKAKCTVLLVKK